MATIRDGRPEDAASLARMISDFNLEAGSPGRITAAGVEALCFADPRPFRALVAEDGEALVGYALIMPYFDTEFCAWCSYLQDLFVARRQRGRGIGRQLIAAAAGIAVEQGHEAIFWHVRDHNRRGRAFYASLGAEEQTPIPMVLTGDALVALAREAT